MADTDPHSGVRIEVGDDWAASAADSIVGLVDSIKAKTTVPLKSAAYGVVYGLLAAVLAIVALFLLTIGGIRALALGYEEWLDAGVWAAHATLGGIFVLFGLFFWTKRRPKKR